MQKVVKLSLIGLVSAMFLGGIALADTGAIGNTGPDSSNNITNNNNQNTNQENNNHVGVDNNSDQTCQSGSANTSSNTNAGGAQSGEANCENTTNTIINIANGSGAVVPAEEITPGKGAGSAPVAENVSAQTAPTSLPRTGLGSNWIFSAVIGSLAVVALKVSLDTMQKNASLSY